MATRNSFNTYKLYAENITKALKKGKVIPLPKGPLEATRQAVKFAMKTQPELLQTILLGVLAEEAHWLRGDRDAYYPANAAVANNLIKSSFKLSNPEVIYRDVESFILNFPSDLTLGGQPAGSGVLVTLCRNDQRKPAIFDPFFNWIDHRQLNLSSHAGEPDEFFIGITYRGSITPEELQRVCLPSNHIKAALESKDAEEYMALMREIDKFDYVDKIDATDDEFKYQYDIIRLVCGFLIYRHALPERIYDGLPGARKQFETPYTMGQRGKVIHQPRRSGETPTDHYRSWHFRQLQNDMYYRGEYKNLPHGSRIIFVADSVVGRNQSPHTIEG